MLKNGTAVRLDFGGTFDFRARGARKEFSNQVSELSTLLDPNINPESAKIFENMTREDLITSLQRVQSVTSDEIQKIFNGVRIDMNPELFTTIRNRKQYLNYVLKEAETTPMKDGQKIQDYVKTLEEQVSKKYNKQISTMDAESAKRKRIMADMKAQRDAVCTDEDLDAIWKYKGNSFTANTCIQRGRDTDPLVTSLDKALDKTTLTEPITLYRGDHLIIDMATNLRYRDDINVDKLHKGYYFEHIYDTQGNLVEQKLHHTDENRMFVTETIDGKTVDKEVTMEEYVNKIFQPGKIVEEKQFVSTTVDRHVAEAFASSVSDIIYKFNAPAGTKGTNPESISAEAVDNKNAIGYLAGNGKSEGSEAEILLKRGFRYQMKKMTFENGHYVIECDILPPSSQTTKTRQQLITELKDKVNTGKKLTASENELLLKYNLELLGVDAKK